jgi:hypothetical protein
MNISVVIPVHYIPPPFLFPSFALLNNSSAESADVAIVIAEDESRWTLDESSFQSLVSRRVPTAFVDPHDYNFFGLSDSRILEESWFLSPLYPIRHPGYKLNRVRRLHEELQFHGVPTTHFKLWMFDKQQGVHPLVPCTVGGETLDDFDTYHRRPFDITFIANRCPQRAAAYNVFVKAFPWRELSGQFHLFDRQRPYSWHDWLAIHKRSKMFFETGAGNQGSSRPVELGTVALMLRQRDRVAWPEDFQWVNGYSCIDMGKPLVPLEYEDLNELRPLLRDREKLYNLYVQCHKQTQQFSPTNVAKYVLDHIRRDFNLDS